MRIYREFIGLSMLFGSVAPLAATPVHKCGLPDGRTVYQSAECARGHRTLARWHAAPDPVVANGTRSARSARAVASTRAAPRHRRRAGDGAPPRDPCRDARARRDAIEREAGLSRTYDLLSALQREVYEACR